MSVSAITASPAMAAWAQSLVPQQERAAQPQLTEQELAQIEELADRDREVRAHEAAHQAAGAALPDQPPIRSSAAPMARCTR